MLQLGLKSKHIFRRCVHSPTPGGDQLREKIVSLCKRRGFVFQNSDIYGGLSGSFDYGPLGAQLKKNIRDKWWNDFVEHKIDCVGIETPILMHTDVWRASGHVDHFADPIVECSICHTTFRHNLIGDVLDCPKKHPTCDKHNLGEKRDFNLLFATHAGTTHDHSSQLYLRPETAQGIFVSFANLCNVLRKALPFGVGQVGRSFRNEISPREFLFRQREFEQMELEYFCRPDEAEHWFVYWRQFCYDFCLSIGLNPTNLRWVEHTDQDKAHYAVAGADIEFMFPSGWGELWGIANRGDFDLRAHSTLSKKDLSYTPAPTTSDPHPKAFFPYVIEPALGLDRLFYAILLNGYTEETVNKEIRVVLKLHESIAPFRVAVLPLSKKDELTKVSSQLFASLQSAMRTDYDVTGSIGRRYRRQDEIGTPYCIVVDFQTLEDQAITIRHRDSMKQIRVPMEGLVSKFNEHIERFAVLEPVANPIEQQQQRIPGF